MSKKIDYSEPLRGFEQQPDAAVNEINALRFTLRRVIEQRDHEKAEKLHWQARYAEVMQQLDEERRKSEPPIVVRTPRRVGPLIELEREAETSDD